jgi:metal-dependent amidase/aminoacylase/carboxypeptidase family protein
MGAQADILWTAASLDETMPVREAVRRVFEEAACAASVSVEVSEFARDSQMRNDPILSKAFRKNSEVLGRIRGQEECIHAEVREIFKSPKLPWVVRLFTRFFPRLVSPPGLFMDKFPVKIMFGTDLANVSQSIPAIHPMIGVGGTTGPHVAEFADDIETEEAFRAMLDGGVALAWTALDAAMNPTIKNYLIESAKTRKVPGPSVD